MVFWHANGFHIFNQVKNYITTYLIENDYKIIDTPQILDKSLWKKSGHLDKFSDLIFDAGSENKEFAIKANELSWTYTSIQSWIKKL